MKDLVGQQSFSGHVRHIAGQYVMTKFFGNKLRGMSIFRFSTYVLTIIAQNYSISSRSPTWYSSSK